MRRTILAVFLLLVSYAYGQDLQTGETLVDGVQYHAADLNNMVNNGTVLPTFISGKGTGSPTGTDSVLWFQAGTSTLKKSSINAFLALGSIALSMPSGFTVAGSPVAGAGTLTVTMASKPANFFLAGPTIRGAADAPTDWRVIRPHDTALASEAGTGTALDCTTYRTFLRTLTANTTYTFTGLVDGEVVSACIKQAAAGGPFTAAFSGVTWKGGGPPTMTTTAGHADIFSFMKIGTVTYGVASQNFF